MMRTSQRRRWVWRSPPNEWLPQNATATESRKKRNQLAASGVTCFWNVRNSQMVVAMSAKPISCLTCSIQAPGRGRRLPMAGMSVSSR